MDCSSNWSYFKYEELRCESVKIALMQLQLVLLKRSKDNVSLDWSAYITPSCDCFVIYLPPCYQASPKQVGRITKKKNSTRQVHQAGFLSPFSGAPMCGKSRKHSFNTEIIVDSSSSREWTPHTIFLCDRNDPLWEWWYNLSNLTNQRVYHELVYRNGSFKEMITGSPQFPPVLFSCLRFFNSADPNIPEPGTD